MKDPPDPDAGEKRTQKQLDFDWSCVDEMPRNTMTEAGPSEIRIGNTAKNRAENRPTFENFIYTPQDSAPYRVYMELKEKRGDQKINKFAVGLMIRKQEQLKNYVTDMKYAGRHRIIVFLSSYAKANLLMEVINATDNPYRAYVPRHLVTITGVISGISEEISEQEIMDGVECDVPILSVRRLTRTADKIPTTRVSVTFRSNQLPEFVKLFCCRSTVRPFYQKVVFCTNCLRFNHRETNCKGRRRCGKCTEQHEQYQKCQTGSKCANCKSTDHLSTDENCPERERQTRIKGLMARKNYTFTEARDMIPIATKNLYEPLNRLEEFPVLGDTFAEMTEGHFKWRNPLREDWIRTNQERKAIKAAIEIQKEKKEQNNASYGKRPRTETQTTNAQKITEERNKLIVQSNSNTSGAGLRNAYAVGQAEKWVTVSKSEKEKIEANAQAKIKAADEKRQEELIDFYADFVTTLGSDEAVKSLFNKCTKKHFNLARSVIAFNEEQK